MSDEHIRELERRWKETGSVEDEARLLAERVRTGNLGATNLRLAAFCGRPAAVSAAGDAVASIADVEDPLSPTDPDWSQWGFPFGVTAEHLTWGNRFARFGREAVVCFCVEVALDWRPALIAPNLEDAVDRAIEVTREWLASPGEAGMWPEVALTALIGDWDEVVYGAYPLSPDSPREPMDAVVVAVTAVTQRKLALCSCAARAIADHRDRLARILSVVSVWALAHGPLSEAR